MAGGTAVTFKFTLSDGTVVEKAFNVNDGLSAYELWQAAGNVGTLEEYLASNKGEKGDVGPEGPMGAMVEFVGTFNTVEELPISVNVNSMATVGTYFYFFDGSEWVPLGNFAGPKGDPGQATFAIKSGNFSSNYPDNVASANAHGFLGTKEYWKITINLDKATYNQYPVCNVLLQELPCDANGVPVPYDLHYFFNSSGANKPPNIVIMLILHEPATQLLSNSSGQYGPLGLVNEVLYEPHYSVSYWY
jgi:hypothetical protein